MTTDSRPIVRERYVNLLAELVADVGAMGERVLATITASIEALGSLDVARAQQIIAGDSEIDSNRHEIGEKAFHVLATQQPTAIDLRLVMAAGRVAEELERIADYCTGIAKLILTMAAEPSGEPQPQITAMSQITLELLRQALGAFRDRNVEVAAAVWLRDDEVDDLYQDFFKFQIEDMLEHKRNVRRGTYMLWIAHNIERMADRVTNIAEAVAFLVTADVANWRSQIESETVPPSF